MFDKLCFTASINDEEVIYEGSKTIKASKLEEALKSKGTDGVVSVDGKKGIKLVGYFDDEAYCFIDLLNAGKLNQSGFTARVQGDYVNWKSEFTITPKTNATFALDFSEVGTKDYKNYNIKTYLGSTAATPIEFSKILVDGEEVDSLNNKMIKNANKVVIQYTKEALGYDDVSIFDNKGCEINDEYYTESKHDIRLEATSDVVSLIIKDVENNKSPIYWTTTWA